MAPGVDRDVSFACLAVDVPGEVIKNVRRQVVTDDDVGFRSRDRIDQERLNWFEAGSERVVGFQRTTTSAVTPVLHTPIVTPTPCM